VSSGLAFLASLASGCGLDVEGTAQPGTTKDPTQPATAGAPAPAGVAGGPPSPAAGDAGVGACSDSVLAFDGSGEFATIAHDPALELDSDFTVEAWIKPGATTTEMHVVSHHAGGDSSGWLLRVASGRVEIVVYGTAVLVDESFSAAGQGAYVVPGKWAFVAGTLKGGTLRVYYDGVLRDSQNLGFLFGRNAYNGDVVIGRAAGGGKAFAYDGQIDDLRLSSTARYTGSTAPRPTAPLAADASTVALYPFNETDGKVHDASSHGHDGLLGSPPDTPTRDLAPCAGAR
jgi:hypothetical protein